MKLSNYFVGILATFSLSLQVTAAIIAPEPVQAQDTKAMEVRKAICQKASKSIKNETLRVQSFNPDCDMLIVDDEVSPKQLKAFIKRWKTNHKVK